MEALYYPFLCLDTPKANRLAGCLGSLNLLCPLALRPRFTVPQVKCVDPLPQEWQSQFRALVSQYQLFKQVYADRSFLEYFKHVPPQAPDEERVGLLTQLLRGKTPQATPKEDFPPEVVCALFLVLAQEYSQGIQTVYQGIKQVEEKEQELSRILDTPQEANIPVIPELNLNYVHPDEGLLPLADKIFLAFRLLLRKTKINVDIAVTDDEFMHHYLKSQLTSQKQPFFSFDLWLPFPFDDASSFWKTLSEAYGADELALKELCQPYLSQPESEAIALELVVLPQRDTRQVLLRDFSSKEKNAIFVVIKGDGHAR